MLVILYEFHEMLTLKKRRKKHNIFDTYVLNSEITIYIVFDDMSSDKWRSKMPLGYTYFVERINIFTYSEKSYSAIMQGNGARLKRKATDLPQLPKRLPLWQYSISTTFDGTVCYCVLRTSKL